MFKIQINVLDIKGYIALWYCIVLGRFLKFFITIKMSNFDGHLLYDSIVFKGVGGEGRWG